MLSDVVKAGYEDVDLVLMLNRYEPEPSERGFAGTDDVQAGVVAVVGSGSRGVVHLGGHEDLVAAVVGAQRVAEEAFGLATSVGVGGIDQADAGVDGGVDDAVRFVLGGGVGEVGGAQAERRDAHAGASQ